MESAGSQPGIVTVIKPSKGIISLDFKEFWQYRELMYFLAWRDVKVKYKQSLLGVAWVVFRPVVSMLVFSVLFGRYAQMPSEGVPYPLFVFLGLLPWIYVSSTLSACTSSVVGSANLVSKIYFPRLIIPMSVNLANLVDFFVSIIVLAGMMIYYHVQLSPGILLLPAAIAMLFFTTIGPGLFLGALDVRYRDVGHIIPFFLQLLMFATPVIYPMSLVPEQYRSWLYLNPYAGPIEAFRVLALGHSEINVMGLCISMAVSVFMFIVGIFYFKKVESTFADII